MSLRSDKQYYKTTFTSHVDMVDWLNRWDFAIDPRFVHILPMDHREYIVVYRASEWISSDRYPTKKERKESFYI